MQINSLSVVAIASTVWNSSVRTLTRLGLGVMNSITGGTGIPNSVNPSTELLLHPATNNFWDVTISVTAGPGGSFQIGLNNGITAIYGQTIPAGQTGLVRLNADNGIGIALKNNDAVNIVPIFVSGWTWFAA